MEILKTHRHNLDKELHEIEMQFLKGQITAYERIEKQMDKIEHYKNLVFFEFQMLTS